MSDVKNSPVLSLLPGEYSNFFKNGEAPLLGPNPYLFIYHFRQKRYPNYINKVKSYVRAKWPIQLELIPVSVALSD